MTSIVVLPNDKCGLTFQGSPPCVQSVSPNSPLRGKINIGQYVHGFVARNEDVVYSGITTTNELGRLLVKHKEEDRTLVLSSKVATLMNRRMTTTITLPDDDRRLGLVFCHGGPPRISDIRVGSPLQNVATEGMFVHALNVPGVQYRGFGSPEEFAYRLLQHSGQNPQTMVLSYETPPPMVEALVRVTLPTGPINARFKTDKPTVVLDIIDDESPLAFLQPTFGQQWRVLSLEVQENKERRVQIDNLNQKFAIYELEQALRDSEKTEGRTITLQRKSIHLTHDMEDVGEAESTVYPSSEDVSQTIHRQSKAYELFGSHTALGPETRVGHTADFYMRTGLHTEDASYYFEDLDGNPLNNSGFRMVQKRVNESSNRKDYWLQELRDGKERPVGLVTESSENGQHGYQIYGCKARHRFTPFWQQKSTMIERHGQKFHPWATVRDSSWKDQIDTREICFYSPDDIEEQWFIPTLFLTRHHLAVLTESRKMVAILFRRNFTDETQRHQWIVSIAPGIDPCFIMCLAMCMDKFVVHI
eukprot:CAMPEP_0194229508 /NCGR_PEP_ID=MMETSP0156-20130528/43931_1 /TAXON_ID=33649 /ORGANISM="Thalassionema nitzschioides, Strain L26-B" /LENGTH=530 /DNA_ID=CAMNT_0038962061 /DNA_START=161 /DNA_END=1753 /DNA_ORIENTATION=+